MLPKIAVSVSGDRTEFLKLAGLPENHIMTFEGGEAKITDFRSWLSSSLGIARHRPELALVIWDADRLSPECQAVLLKPMEELEGEMKMILVVQNENQLSPTILSRGVIEVYPSRSVTTEVHWSEVRKCWSSGPSASIAYIDRIKKEEAVPLVEEVIQKLKTGLATEVNEKRLAVLGAALECLQELKQTNINYKLAMDNFLIGSWRMIKA